MSNNREQIISAIKSLGCKVTAADLAAKTGLSLYQATLGINQIALDCRGIIQVTNTGNIMYDFEPSFEQNYVSNIFKEQLKALAKTAFNIFYYIVRVSFGILLIASFITIAVVFAIALVIILIGYGELADGDGGDGEMDMGMDLGFDFYDIGNLFLFFNWRWFDDKYDPRDDEDEYSKYLHAQKDKGFFLNCFSFLFGDGDPNIGLEKKKWRYIAELIRKNNGVVTSEQLAPYTGSDPRDDNATLATLVRFEGLPEVSPTGNIVYIFPKLQTIAAPIVKTPIPNYLEEKHWQFTTQPLERLFPVYFFGGANLAGCYCLWQHLPSMSWLQPFGPIIGFMLSYAVFFLGLPIIRQIGNTFANAAIDYRNQYKSACYEHLQDANTTTKLLEAKQFAQQTQNLNREKIIYSTAEDILDQEFND